MRPRVVCCVYTCIIVQYVCLYDGSTCVCFIMQYAYTHVYVYVDMYVYVCMCVCVCIYIYIYMYIYTISGLAHLHAQVGGAVWRGGRHVDAV